MSGKRKLSFLGYAPQGEEGEDEVRLDDEMERVVWGEGGAPAQTAPPPRAGSPPRRDVAAPAPAPSTDATPALPNQSEDQQSTTSPRDEERRVQFGRATPSPPPAPVAPYPSSDALADDADDERRSQRNARHLHPHHKSRKYSLQEGGAGGAGSAGGGGGVATPPAEEPLGEADRDDLRAHRSDDPRALRRHLIHPRGSTVHVGRRDGGDKPQAILPDATLKKMYDHSPHSMFVQLDELVVGEEGEAEWRETARWIKYEEAVEEGSARFGPPHVASLSFHSLLNLRRCLETGAVLLDLDERDLPGVAYRVAEAMVALGLVGADDEPAVMRALLVRHKHVHDGRPRFSISGAIRKHSSYTSLQSLWMEEGGASGTGAARARCSLCTTGAGAGAGATGAGGVSAARRHSSHLLARSPPNVADAKRRRSSYALQHVGGGAGGAGAAGGEARKKSSVALDMREVEYLAAAAAAPGSSEELRRPHHDAILKRIPSGAEASAVLVGEVGFLHQPTAAFVRLAHGVPMPSVTEVPLPVRFLFVLLCPPGSELDHHEVGRSLATLMANPTFHSLAYRAEERRELLSGINEFLDDSIVLPPGDWERQALLPFDELRAKSEMIRRRKREAQARRRASLAPHSDKQALLAAEKEAEAEASEKLFEGKERDDPLVRTGRLFGGVVRDMQRRYPHYASDFRDALNGQCAAATIFMYFAALSGAITFGGLLNEKTHGQIGISETLLFTCVGGVVFALTAGQPLMITGATGPLLLLDQALADFCRGYGFDLLAARFYAGLWMVLIALAVASVEGSVAVKKITRFTEDIFAFLISLIFISEPITNMMGVYRAHPLGADYCANATTHNATGNLTNLPLLNGTNATAAAPAPMPEPALPRPNTALFCTMLTLSTFAIAYYLRIFRNGKFLGRSARRALGDFGVPIAIALMVGVSCAVPVWTETLRVPAGLAPTAARAWLVPLNGARMATVPLWAALAMAAPALMVYIIVFMETHIAELIVDKPERRLQKGSGFHMDIVIMALVNALCGACGAPWQCVATVRSVSHVSALTVMSTTHAPGDKPHIVHVKEQRLTGLLVSVLVGLSVLAAGVLRLVPLAVLFGVFLYMGISSLGGIQFWDRCILLFKPVKHHPQVPYVKRVPTLRMHLFTLIQLAGIAVLYAVKSSRFSLALPFFLVLMVPLRMALVYVFTPMQLRALDGVQKDIDKDDEPDFYEEAALPG